MGFFRKARTMAGLAKTFSECQAGHPRVWELGTNLADDLWDSRTEYLVENTRTQDGVSRYIRLTTEQLVMIAAAGRLEEEMGVTFPGPATEEALKCFGISIGKRLQDRYDRKP